MKNKKCLKEKEIMKCEDIKQFTRDGSYRVNATMEQLVNILRLGVLKIKKTTTTLYA